jgi:hypothetical protein
LCKTSLLPILVRKRHMQWVILLLQSTGNMMR